jgi:FKBP-type peptidyl-prolyl cis-trans isomerase FklB
MSLTKSKVSMIAVLGLGAGLALSHTYAVDSNKTQSKQPSTIKKERKMSSTSTTTTTSASPSSVKNQTPGETFLAKNKNQPGVVTLPNGLQYKVIAGGKGAKPKASDVVTVNYAGKLIDGTEFDSSYKRGMPASFPVNGVIAGWTEALQLMNVGSTWELYIPAGLAYGTYGAPPIIGANQTLIFKVELLDIKNANQA